MATPSEKYAVDYTDGYGFKWTKAIKQIFTTLGNIDMSAALSRFNDPLVQNVYRKSRIFNPIYDNSITYASAGHDSLVMKYFSRSGYPSENMTSGTVLVNYSSPDGQSYVTGVNEDAATPYNGGLGDARVLVDAAYNKMLFKVVLREMDLGLNPSPVAGAMYNDPSYTDVDLKDVDPDKWYALFYHSGAKVWNGSSWDDQSIAPVMICNGDSVQSFQGGGSSFNNLFNNYNGTMGSGQIIEFSNTTSNYYWSGHNFVNKMNIDDYSLGWSGSYDYKPSYADDMDGMKSFMLNYLLDNNYSPWQSVWFQLCREIHTISNDMSILLTCMCYACLDGNNDLYINWDNIYTFPVVKGSSISKFLAGYGLYYLADTSADLTGITPDTLHNCSGVWLGEMAADGTTTGKWIKGADIENYDGYNKNNNIVNPDFDPSGGGGSGGDEDNKDPINTTGAPFAAGLCNYYAMTAGSPLLDHISEALGTWDIENTHKDLYKNLVSCKLIKPPAPIPTSGSSPFTIYGVKPQYNGADISLPVVSGNPEATFGPYSVPRKFGDFRDYAPYTRASIYLPYCGWCDLPSHVVGKQVSVKYFTDIIAATCKAIVFCGENIIAEAAGVIGLDIPFVADNVGAKMQAVTAGMLAALGGGIQLGAGIGTMVSTRSGSGAKSALSGASQYLSGYSQMAMAFNENTTEISGKNGDGCCLSGATNIIIKIVRPLKGAYTDPPYTPPGYGHNIGFVSQKQVKVSSVSGLLIADNVDTSGISGATEAERAEIKRVLETGLIVNAAPE